MTHSDHTTQKTGRILVYTAIFGKKDVLQEPRVLVPNCDFVCITDQPFRSTNWRVRYTPAPFPDDLTRSNRMYKILAHKFFPEYERSIYIDGNMIVRGDLNVLVEEALRDAPLAFFNHAENKNFPCDCIYDEADHLEALDRQNKTKDNPELTRAQVEHYRGEGYPAHNGLVTGMVIVRQHNDPVVVRVMDKWWEELLRWSKRDQLSFNYIAWKEKIPFSYLHGDSTDNEYFYRVPHRRSPEKVVLAYLRSGVSRVARIFGKMK